MAIYLYGYIFLNLPVMTGICTCCDGSMMDAADTTCLLFISGGFFPPTMLDDVDASRTGRLAPFGDGGG